MYKSRKRKNKKSRTLIKKIKKIKGGANYSSIYNTYLAPTSNVVVTNASQVVPTGKFKVHSSRNKSQRVPRVHRNTSMKQKNSKFLNKLGRSPFLSPKLLEMLQNYRLPKVLKELSVSELLDVLFRGYYSYYITINYEQLVPGSNDKTIHAELKRILNFNWDKKIKRGIVKSYMSNVPYEIEQIKEKKKIYSNVEIIKISPGSIKDNILPEISRI